MRRILLALGLLVLPALMVLGCVYIRSAESPMRAELDSSRTGAKNLIVFLPGLGDSPDAFVEGGFIEEARRLRDFDLMIADAHFGYYREATIVRRLHEDIISKRRPVYEKLWLVGVSMGGYGALAYEAEHPGVVDGLILLAPYLGEDRILASLEEAGSLEKWDPNLVKTDDEREKHEVFLWTHLKKRSKEPPLYVGSGASDRHMRQIRLLQPRIEKNRFLIVPGDHDWVTWRSLFRSILEVDFSNHIE